MEWIGPPSSTSRSMSTMPPGAGPHPRGDAGRAAERVAAQLEHAQAVDLPDPAPAVSMSAMSRRIISRPRSSMRAARRRCSAMARSTSSRADHLAPGVAGPMAGLGQQRRAVELDQQRELQASLGQAGGVFDHGRPPPRGPAASARRALRCRRSGGPAPPRSPGCAAMSSSKSASTLKCSANSGSSAASRKYEQAVAEQHDLERRAGSGRARATPWWQTPMNWLTSSMTMRCRRSARFSAGQLNGSLSRSRASIRIDSRRWRGAARRP